MRERGEGEGEREAVYVWITTVLLCFSINSEAVALIGLETMLPAPCWER